MKFLDYSYKPIGKIKLELSVHMFMILILSFLSGKSETINMIYNESFPSISYPILVLITFLCWCRISYLISTYLKAKQDIFIVREKKEEQSL